MLKVMFLCVYVGSDVNSMDSVDSGCTMGAVESQSNHAASSSSDLIIWEIEVPKVSQDNWHEKKKQKVSVWHTVDPFYTIH